MVLIMIGELTVLGDNCRSGCRSKSHANWGECVRAAGITVTPVDGQAKRIDHELDSYAKARKQGIQPAGTSQVQIDAAVQVSEKVGKAWNANNETFKN